MNKRGFTIAEVIVSFSLVTVILVSVISTTVYYRNVVKEEEIITQLTDYKNNITKIIYDDILTHKDNKIISVERCIGISNCLNFIDKKSKNNTHVLKIEEILESDEISHTKRGVYLNYDGNKYMLPDSDLGKGDERVCDFVGGFTIDHYVQDKLSLYTVKTSFKHKYLDKKYDIILTITHYDEDKETG